MATKRKTREQETVKIEKKKKMVSMEDRLSDLPESLQLHILASLDIKHAIHTSRLSRTWRSMWTQIPVLELKSFRFNKPRVFDKFVRNVLSRRALILVHRDHSAKLERLNFHRSGVCSGKLLNTVFYFACLFRVKKLEVYVQDSKNKIWPIYEFASFDSLTSLKLESQILMRFPLNVPISRSFKNLTVLHLKRTVIPDSNLFSRFPMLESLTLRNCHYLCIEGGSKTMSIHALRLSELTISSLQSINCFELTTPRLRFLDYGGPDFPLLRNHEGLPSAPETVVIDFWGVCFDQRQEKRMFDALMDMFSTLQNVKSLTLFSSVVQLLSFFPDELVKRSSPFRELKDLKMNFWNLYFQKFFDRPLIKMPSETFEVPLDVKAYLLHNSLDAKFTFTYPMQDRVIRY